MVDINFITCSWSILSNAITISETGFFEIIAFISFSLPRFITNDSISPFISSSALMVPMTLYNFCPWFNNFSMTYFEFSPVPTTITLCRPKPFLSNCF